MFLRIFRDSREVPRCNCNCNQSGDNDDQGVDMRGGDGQEADLRSGDQILRSLGIFSPIMVYCRTNDALVQVTDRLSPVELCCMLDSLTGLYLTASS